MTCPNVENFTNKKKGKMKRNARKNKKEENEKKRKSKIKRGKRKIKKTSLKQIFFWKKSKKIKGKKEKEASKWYTPASSWVLTPVSRVMLHYHVVQVHLVTYSVRCVEPPTASTRTGQSAPWVSCQDHWGSRGRALVRRATCTRSFDQNTLRIVSFPLKNGDLSKISC